MTIVNLTSGIITVITAGIAHTSKVPLHTIEYVFGNMLKSMNFRKVKATDNLTEVSEGDNAFIEVVAESEETLQVDTADALPGFEEFDL
jgi:hypothetical protein